MTVLTEWNATQRKALKALRSRARALHCDLVVMSVGNTNSAELIAPSGRRFCEELHCLVSDCYKPYLPDYVDMLDRLNSYGIEVCDTPECEWCNS